MKIIHFISQLGNGGAEKFVVELSNELSKDNEVIVVSFRDIKEWMFFPKRLKKDVKLITLNKKDGFSVKLIFKLYWILIKYSPDVVHIHLDSTMKYFMFVMPFFPKIEFVYTMHSEYKLFEDFFKKFHKLWFFKRVKFVCLSDKIKRDFDKNFNDLDINVVENGIAKLINTNKEYEVKRELDSLRDTKDTKIFLFIGRLSYEKNIPLLLQLFKSLEDRDLKLVIIGQDVSPNREYIKLIEKYQSSKIVYLGQKENVQDYMKYGDVLILTSVEEGMPLVVLEAFSYGLPVISTPVGGMVDLIENGENGFLSKGVDLDSLKETIDRFLSLPKESLEEISKKNISKFNKNYSISKSALKYKSIYSKNHIKIKNRQLKLEFIR